jgi:DNA-binding beta-propeller fold protein YncE
MTRHLTLLTGLLAPALLSAQLTILTQFDPSNTGGTCGIAYNSVAGEVLVIGCFGATIDRYTEAGAFLSAAPIAGESANDVDVDMSPVAFVMNGTAIEQGQLLFMNGETAEADIYAIDEVTMEVIDTLETAFGVSHVVGGSYHPTRGTFFLVQDQVPGGFQGNRIAEVDAATGDTLQTFSTLPAFAVDYGDLDISPVSGHLFVVSSAETTIAEFTPEGVLVTEHPLPGGVSSLSGIALDNDLQGAWVCNTNGVVFKLGNFPVGVNEVGTSAHRLTILPNPAQERIVILLNEAVLGTVSMAVLDATGKVVAQGSINALANGSSASLDVSRLLPGCYDLRMVSGRMREHARFVIAR